MKKKRHQHYVWRKYLRSWATNEKIACLREGKIFEANLMGIGQKRDFYKLRELSSGDFSFIKYVIDSTPRKHLQKLHTKLVKQFNIVFEIKELVNSTEVHDQELEEALDTAINNLEEDLHTTVENSAIKYIESILQEDIEFYYTDEGCMEFIYFLCEQYMRTENVKNNALQSVSHFETVNLENAWNILSHIFATNIGWTLYAERKRFKMVLLKNNTEKEFITGDQPVINTYADFNMSNPPLPLGDDEIELYYPVSPRIAILLSYKEENESIRLKLVNENDVVSYNNLIAKNSHSQVYATSIGVLEEYNR
jgi:2-hydroxy-3-keto-5-methylthiopentenyl-1-phosphate phosphatase